MSTPTPPPATTNGSGAVRGWRRLLPRSLFSRVTLIIVVGLAIAQLLTFASIRYERGIAMRELMMIGIERDIASSVAILDRLPVAERGGWLARLEQRNYRFVLGGGVAEGIAPASPASQQFAKAIMEAMQPVQIVKVVQLAEAAGGLGPDLKARRLAEEGPSEVAHAARAFNTMQVLVREGVTYARTLHGATEAPCRIDADALFESMVADYEDTGRHVVLEGRAGAPIVTRPNALRRILASLIDKALGFGSDVRVLVASEPGRLVLRVVDNGPGIPAAPLEAVLKPFYRVEGSRNRNTGGTGLGLAIAHQLARATGAERTLRNRAASGLEARLALDTVPT